MTHTISVAHTITLVRTIPAGDGEIYAVWRDETAEGSYEFAAIHDSSGRAVVANMDLQAPRLSQAQITEALTPAPAPDIDTEAAKEARSQARALANREWQLTSQINGHQAIRQREQQANTQRRFGRNNRDVAAVKRQALAELGIGGTA